MTSGPVFVDATGRRARVVGVVCWALALVFAGYVVLVAVALVTPPGTLSLTVPGLGPVLPKTQAPPLTTTDGSEQPPASALASPTPTPTATRAAVVGTRPPVVPPSSAPATRPAAGPTTRPPTPATGRPTAKPTPAATGRATGRPTQRPTPNPRSSKTPPPHP